MLEQVRLGARSGGDRPALRLFGAFWRSLRGALAFLLFALPFPFCGALPLVFRCQFSLALCGQLSLALCGQLSLSFCD